LAPSLLPRLSFSGHSHPLPPSSSSQHLTGPSLPIPQLWQKRDFWTICVKHGPQITREGVTAVALWVGFQALLFLYLPGELHTGQYTPAGHRLTYRLNGFWSWILTHVVYFVLCCTGILDPAFISRNWSSVVAALNLAGFLAPALAFIKAYLSPTHPEDCKFSGMFAF